MNISHIDVYLHLHQGVNVSSTSSFPTNESASPTVQCGENEKFVTVTTKDGAESRKYYLDKCFPPTTTQHHIFRRTEDLVDMVMKGFSAAAVTMGVGSSKASKYDRAPIISATLQNLQQKITGLDGIHISYAFLGITDSKCVNLLDDRNVQLATIIQDGLEPVLRQVDSIEEIGKKVRQGSSLPFILGIRLEKSGDKGFIGNLLVADLGNCQFDQPSPLSGPVPLSRLARSFSTLRDIVKLISHGGYTGLVPYGDSILTSVLADYLGGTAKMSLFMDMDTRAALTATSIASALDFAETLRKIKCRETRNLVDRRVAYYEGKYEHYRKEYYDLQDEMKTRSQMTREKENTFADMLEAKEKELSGLHEEKDGLLNDVKKLKRETHKWEKELSGLHKEKDGLLDEVEKLKRETHKWEKELSGLHKEKDGLLDEVEKLGRETRKWEKEYAILQAQCKRFEADSQLERASEKKAMLELKEELRKISVRLSVVNDERDEAESELKRLQFEHIGLQNERECAKAELQKLQKSVDGERNTVETKDLEIEQLKEKVLKKDAEIDRLQEDLKKKDAEIRGVKDAITSEKIKEAATIVSQKEKLQKVWDVEREKFVQQIKELERELSLKKESDLRALTVDADIVKLKAKVARLKEKLTEAVEFASKTQIEFAEERGRWQGEREALVKASGTVDDKNPPTVVKKVAPKRARKPIEEIASGSESDTASKPKKQPAKKVKASSGKRAAASNKKQTSGAQPTQCDKNEGEGACESSIVASEDIEMNAKKVEAPARASRRKRKSDAIENQPVTQESAATHISSAVGELSTLSDSRTSMSTSSLPISTSELSKKADKPKPLGERPQNENAVLPSSSGAEKSEAGVDPLKKKKRKLNLGNRLRPSFGFEALTDLSKFNILPQNMEIGIKPPPLILGEVNLKAKGAA